VREKKLEEVLKKLDEITCSVLTFKNRASYI